MDSTEFRICSSSVQFSCDSYPSTQSWSEQAHKSQGDCLIRDFVSSLPEEPCANFTRNGLSDLATLWGQYSISEKQTFRKTYGNIASLISVPVEEPVLKAALRFWDPSYRCFTYGKEDLVPTIEEYSVLIGLDLQFPDKAYNKKPNSGYRKVLAKILKVKPRVIDTYLIQKGSRQGLPWRILQSFIQGHLRNEDGMTAFALAIYGLVIFPGILGYIDMAVVDAFDQIQHGSNPALAILAETFRSLNYCRRNREGRFLGCTPLLYIWIRSHIICEGITFTKSYFPGAAPITEFCQNTWPASETEEWWVATFQNPSQVQWMAPWMSRPPLLYRCGNLLWVPLFGPWGMISYTPLLALRQFGAKQFIPATGGLGSSELSYDQSDNIQMLSQVMQAWKEPHRTRLSQLVGGCTPEYIVWRRQKLEDAVSLPDRMKIPISDPVPAQPSEIEIVRAEFASERLEMEQKYLRLQETADRAESNARIQEHKAQRMVDVCAKAKDETESLYIANKKLWEENRNTRIGRFFGNQRREGESSQRESNQWKAQACKAQTKARHWESEHSVISEELSKCRKSRASWKRKAESGQVQCQEVQEEKVALQKAIQVLEHQLLRQGGRINQVIQDWRDNDEEWRRMYGRVANSNAQLTAQNRGGQMYIDHITVQVKKIVHESRRMSEKTQALIEEYYPRGSLGQRLQDFLEEVRGQYEQVVRFYEANSDVLNF